MVDLLYCLINVFFFDILYYVIIIDTIIIIIIIIIIIVINTIIIIFLRIFFKNVSKLFCGEFFETYVILSVILFTIKSPAASTVFYDSF